jgi:hypothetical protein
MTKREIDKIRISLRKYGEYKLSSGEIIVKPFAEDGDYFLHAEDGHTIAYETKLENIIKLVD